MNNIVGIGEIKWIRLRECCERVLDVDRPNEHLIVEIYCATDIEDTTRAAIVRNNQRVEIALNLLYNKNLEDVIMSLAHELTHVSLREYGHPRDFESKVKHMAERLTRLYQTGE